MVTVQSNRNQQNYEFEVDPFPGNPKILFVGLVESSHTHAWNDLLHDSKFNIRLFAVPVKYGGFPLENCEVRTYLSVPQPPEDLDPNRYQCLYPTIEARLEAAVARVQEIRHLGAGRRRRQGGPMPAQSGH